jgi:5-methyltetrahydrofolate--homocysteine methyltransferase
MHAMGREVPIQVQVTMETTGRMLVGTEIGAALTALLAMKPAVIGINCATGPAEMQEHLRHLAQHSPIPISVLPNAGLPSVVDGKTHYDLTPAQLAEFHRHHVQDLGITVVGGCCGTTPEHLRQVVEAVRNVTPARRNPVQDPSVTSLYSPVTLKQDNSVLYIGERTNANGSRAFRDAMLASDWDTCTKMANEQIREGAHVLDVCVDYVGRDGTLDMKEVAGRFASQASVPLVIDSTEPQVMEAALHPQLGQLGRRRRARSPHGPRLQPRARLRRCSHLPLDRRARPGARRGVEDADRTPSTQDRHRAIRAVGE